MNLINTRGKRVCNKGRDLIHEPIGSTRMQDSGIPAHLRTRFVLEPVVPIVHDPTLPCAIHRVSGCHRRVKKSLSLL